MIEELQKLIGKEGLFSNDNKNFGKGILSRVVITEDKILYERTFTTKGGRKEFGYFLYFSLDFNLLKVEKSRF